MRQDPLYQIARDVRLLRQTTIDVPLVATTAALCVLLLPILAVVTSPLWGPIALAVWRAYAHF